MELLKLTQRIYCLPYSCDTDRPSLFYINGDNCSAAIDAGNSPAHVRLFYDLLAQSGLRLPACTVLTHWHWDHTFGLHAIAGRSIASALTNRKLREVAAWEWTEEKMRQRERTGEDIAFCNDFILKEYADLRDIRVTLADEEVTSERTLELGGVQLHLLVHDSPHSRDSLFIHVPQEGALLVGDSDSVDFYDGERYEPARLRSLIDFYESLPYQLHLFAHGDPESKESVLARLRGEYAKLPR